MAVPQVNWQHNGKFVTDSSQFPEGCIGFIYLITTNEGRYYYGRKAVLSYRKKRLTIKEKLIAGNSRKIFKVDVTESAWKKYCGSNKMLTLDIKNGVGYKKEIIQYCFTKAEMTYHESRAILCSDCLKTEACYNDWVSCKVFKRMLK